MKRIICFLLTIIYCSCISQANGRNGLSWSPDGTQILFLFAVKKPGKSNKDKLGYNQVFTMDKAGNNIKELTYLLADAEDPAFSPDGKQITFTSYIEGRNQIYIMNADGTFQKNISNSTTNEFYPVWSAQGNKIAFQSSRDKTTQIYIMNPDGTDVKRVGDLEYNNSDPLWSPDGTKIICRSIKLPDFNKNSLIDVTSGSSKILDLDYKQGGSFLFKCFTKDGAHVFYEDAAYNFSLNGFNSPPSQSLYLYDMGSEKSSIIEKNLSNFSINGCTTNNDSLLIFEKGDLYLFDVSKKKKKKIYSDVGYADFSPVNNLIVFIADNKMYTIGLDGSNKTNLTKR